MKKKDHSKEIFEKYFSSKEKMIKVTLKNNEVLEGIFVSFIHGDESADEPFIIKWHFIDKKDIERYKNFPQIDFGEEYGKEIDQSEIRSVSFKEN